MNHLIVKATSESPNTINCRTRGDDGKSHYIQLTSLPDYYFYIDKRDESKLSGYSNLISKKEDIKAKSGDFVKVFFKSQYISNGIRDSLKNLGMRLYEADLNYVTKTLIDLNIKKVIGEDINLKYKVLYFDVECENSIDFPDENRDRILSIGMVDREGNEKVFSINNYNNSEKLMFSNMIEYMESYDIVTAWNGDGFDFPYLRRRFELNGLSLKILDKWQFIDLMLAYKRLLWRTLAPKTSYSLENVAKVDLNLIKIDKGKDYQNLFKTNTLEALEYNLEDCRLIKKIDEKFNIIDFFIEISKICYIDLNQTLIYSRVIDGMVMRHAHERGYILGSKNYDVEESEESKYVGGYVLEPSIGQHDNVLVFDFQSMYSSVIRTFNICFSTKNKEGTIVAPGNQIHFNEERGVVPEILDNIAKERNEIKKLMFKEKEGSDLYKILYSKQYGLKTLGNTIYGVYGYSRSRFYDVDLATSITTSARFLINEAKTFIEAMGYKVLYIDTDSLMVKVGAGDLDSLISKGKELEDSINSYLVQLVSKYSKYNYVSLEFESVYKRLLIMGKKRYIANVIWNEGEIQDTTKIKGIELRRSDYNLLCKNIEQKVLDILMSDGTKEEKFEKIKNNVLILKEDLFNGKIDNELILNKTLNPRGYKTSDLPHVLAAQKAEKKGIRKAHGGDKVPFIVIGYNENKRLDAVPPEMFKDLSENSKRIAYQYNFYIYVKNVIDRFLEVYKMNFSDIDNRKIKIKRLKVIPDNQGSLARFM